MKRKEKLMKIVLALALMTISSQAQAMSCTQTELGEICVSVEDGELVITQVETATPPKAGECTDTDVGTYCFAI